MSNDDAFMIVVICASSMVSVMWCILMIYYWRTNGRPRLLDSRYHDQQQHPPPMTADTVVRVFIDSNTSSNQSETQCYICADMCANVRLQPCNHGGLCYACVIRIRNSKCPLCRVHFTGLWLSHITD